MAFKIKAPYVIDNTPIYSVDEEDGVLGRANNNGTIIINNKIKDPKQLKEVIKHEKVHADDFMLFAKTNGKKGMDYDDNKITYNSKSYARKNGKIKYQGKWRPDGWPGFPWEKKAYKKEKK